MDNRHPRLPCRRYAALGAFAALLITAAAGCRPGSRTADEPDAPPALNVVALDRSGSTTAMRGAQEAALRAAYARAAKWDEQISVYVVDSKAACVLPPTRARRGQDLSPSVLSALQTPPSMRATRTRPALFWEQMADQFGDSVGGGGSRTPAAAVRILYLTDGDDDWYGEDARVSAAAARLAKNPRVSVALLGLDKDAYDRITKEFAPFGKERAVYSVGGDQSSFMQGLTELREKGEESQP